MNGPFIEADHGEHSYAPIPVLGPGTAGRKYWDEFKALPPSRFGVIKISGKTALDPYQLEVTGRAVAFLQGVGLTPVLVNGAGPQIDMALEEAGIESRRDPEDNSRFTTPAAALVIASAVRGVTETICEAIDRYGGQSQGITSGVIEASLMDVERYGMVGRVARINDEAIHDAIADERIPVIGCMGTLAVDSFANDSQQPVNVDADVAAAAVAVELKSHKYIALTREGAVLDANLNRIKSLTPRTAKKMKRKGTISAGMIPKVNEAFQVLDNGVDQVVFISPEALLLELFTDGAGTIIEKPQKRILSHLMGLVFSRG